MANIKIYQFGDMFKIIWYKKEKPIIDYSDIFLDDFGVIDNRVNINDEKLDNNISRAKGKIIEYALCNDWQYFFTLTLDDKKQYRYNLDAFVRALGNWIGNYNKKYNTKMKYILIPEEHKKGGWHMHGLVKGITEDSIVKNKYGYLDLPYYFNRFGYISLSPIKSYEKIAFYITKYISKDLCKRAKDVNKHLFYSSHGLKEKTLYYDDDLPIDYKYLEWFYQNEYCGILWADNLPSFVDQAYYQKYEIGVYDDTNYSYDNNVS